MEHLEYRQTLQQQNSRLKSQYQIQTNTIHNLLQQCLDLCEPVLPQNCQSLTQNASNHQLQLQQLFTHQMQNLALQSSALAQNQLTLTNKLLSQQVYEAQSVQMLAMLQKYHESILPLRNVLVQKQNAVYYKLKDIYECFEDQYYNCVPKLSRLVAVQKNCKNKQTIIKQLKLLAQQQQKLLKDQQKGLFQDKQNTLTNRIDMSRYGLGQAEEIVEVEEHEDVQCTVKYSKQNCIQARSKQLELAHQRYGLSLDPKMFTLKSSKKSKGKRGHKLFEQQATSVSLTNHYQHSSISASPRLSSLPPAKIQTRRTIPNFSQMSKHDFELFRVYSNKIDRQTERYQKLLMEYNNYRDVYQVISQENIVLIQKINSERYGADFCQESQRSQDYLQDSQFLQQCGNQTNKEELCKLSGLTLTPQQDPKQQHKQGQQMATVDQFTIRPNKKVVTQIRETLELNRLSEELDNELKGLGGQDEQSSGTYYKLGARKQTLANNRGKNKYTILVRNQIIKDMHQQEQAN